MSDDEAKRSAGGGWAVLAIGCGALGLFWMCGGPALIALMFVPGVWGRGAPMVAPMPASPSPPPGFAPTTPGEGGPHMPPPPSGATAASVGPTRVSVTLYVEEAVGTALVSVGDSCTVDVTHDPTAASLPCRAEVLCNGTTLYGGAGQGFYPCEATPGPLGLRFGIDDAPTSDDGDPRFGVSDEHVEVSDDDGPLGTFRVWLTLPPTSPN